MYPNHVAARLDVWEVVVVAAAGGLWLTGVAVNFVVGAHPMESGCIKGVWLYWDGASTWESLCCGTRYTYRPATLWTSI